MAPGSTENRKRSRRLVSIGCRSPPCPRSPSWSPRCTESERDAPEHPARRRACRTGPSFKPDLLGSPTVTILCRPIRAVRVARPLVRRDRLGAHERGDVELQVRCDATGTNAGQLAARNVTAVTFRRSSGTTSARLIRRAPIPLSRVSACCIGESLRPCDPGRIQIGVATCLRLWVFARAVSNEGAAGLSFEPACVPGGAGRARQPLLSRIPSCLWS